MSNFIVKYQSSDLDAIASDGSCPLDPLSLNLHRYAAIGKTKERAAIVVGPDNRGQAAVASISRQALRHHLRPSRRPELHPVRYAPSSMLFPERLAMHYVRSCLIH